MNRPSKFPLASPLASTGAARIAPDRAEPLTGSAEAPIAPTYSRCPDCDGPFTYRFRDEDTGCSYPVDPGEHYCEQCDSIWSDECLGLSQPQGWSRIEL